MSRVTRPTSLRTAFVNAKEAAGRSNSDLSKSISRKLNQGAGAKRPL